MDPIIIVAMLSFIGICVTVWSNHTNTKSAAVAEKAAMAARDVAVDAREAAVLAKEIAQATAEVGQHTARQVAEIAINVDGNLTKFTNQAKEMGLLLGRAEGDTAARAEQAQRDAISAATLAGANAALAAQNQAVPPGFVVTQAPAPTPPIPPAAPVPVVVVAEEPVPVDVVVHVDHEKQAPPDSTETAKGEPK